MSKSRYLTAILVFTSALTAGLVFAATNVYAANSLISRVKGKILLQVEAHGEAWYVNPADSKKYYLGTQEMAFDIMKKLGIGITNADLSKMPVGLIADNNTDTDKDGLNDDLEKALGTDPNMSDTDGDSYSDKVELEKNYDPNGAGSLKYDYSFTKTNEGKIFLQVETNGGAWYVNPADQKRYFLNRPSDAYSIMRSLGLGITTADLEKIVTGSSGVATNDYKITDSPFALQGPFMSRAEDSGYITNEEAASLLADAGVKEVRMLLPELEKYDIDNLLTEKNIAITSDIAPPIYPADLNKYEDEIRASVKKFKNNVNAWIIANEAEANWKNTKEKYAEYFIAVSKAIKSEDPDALVVLNLAGSTPTGDMASPDGLKFLDAALKNGVGSYFDVLDIHIQGPASNYTNLKKIVSDYNAVFDTNGVERKLIWNTEYGTYDGDPDEDPKLPGMQLSYQSEATQASGLIKKYIYGLSVGLKKMFWSQMVEWSHYGKDGSGNDYFSNVGLIHNSRNDGKSYKKLAYYSYKKLVEILDGSDWNDIQTIQSSDGIYMIKFNKNGKNVWAVWNDNSGEKTITISGIASSQVSITEALPKYGTGKEVTDYGSSFNVRTERQSGGKVSIAVGDAPLFIEEK